MSESSGDQWADVVAAAADGRQLAAQVITVVKGGLIVSVGGVRGFLPAHLIDLDLAVIAPLDQYLGQTLVVRVIEVNKPGRNCVVSRLPAIAVDRATRAAGPWSA